MARIRPGHFSFCTFCRDTCASPSTTVRTMLDTEAALMQEQQQVNKARLIGYGIGIVAVAIVLVAKFVLKF